MAYNNNRGGRRPQNGGGRRFNNSRNGSSRTRRDNRFDQDDDERQNSSYEDSEHRSRRFEHSDDDNRGRRFGHSDDDNRGRRFGHSDDDNRGRRFERSSDDNRGKRFEHSDDDNRGRRFGHSNDDNRRRRLGHNDDDNRGRRSSSKSNTHRDGGYYGNREGREAYGAKQRRNNTPNRNDLWNEGYETENIDTRRGAYRADKNDSKPYPTAASEGLIRLNKYISNAGICSRREADELIAAGSVTVNGKVITEMGYKVKPGDTVAYGGETLRSERKRYFLMNKPKGFITTIDDPQERQTVMMLIDSACPERIYPVGRLDRNTTGLLLFTNDGEMAKKLTHPSTGVYKIYHVELNKPVTADDMRQMREGIVLEDGPIAVDDVQYVTAANDKRIVGVELHSGKNRIVRRIFEHLGYDVHKLDRVVFAGLTKKDLPRGRYRELTEKEVNFLKMI